MESTEAARVEGSDPFQGAARLGDRFLDNIETVVHGKREEIKLVVAALVCGGHVLFEDVPGTAKTVLARAIAQSIDGATPSRIQCTPDLQPTDVTGLSIFNQKERDFEFRPGPIFANVVLVDEINRAMPKTQSALLEAMAEQQVTVDGETRVLPDPFLLLATENPIEYEGTFPLPEAQLDRFLLKLQVNFPPADEEDRILRLYQGRSGLGHPLDILPAATPAPVEAAPPDAAAALPALAAVDGWAGVSRVQILRAREEVAKVGAKPEVCNYIGKIARLTREMDKVLMGASSRAAVHLLQAAKVRALMSGRAFVTPDDVKRVCRPVLRHRITLQPDAYLEGFTADDILTTVLERVEVPR